MTCLEVEGEFAGEAHQQVDRPHFHRYLNQVLLRHRLDMRVADN